MNIIPFPSTPEAKSRISVQEIDREIAEVHAKVDREIYDRHGSIEAYGKHIIKQMMKGEWGCRL